MTFRNDIYGCYFYDMIDYDKICNFDSFIAEKMGVVEREMYQEVDTYGISGIINRFMEHVHKFPNDDYDAYEPFFGALISIKYRPNSGMTGINGKTGNRMIFIYRRYVNERTREFKYTLVHELVHMMHQILSENERPYEDLDIIGKLRYILIKTSVENLGECKDTTYLGYLLYMVDVNEVYSMGQTAYLKAFDCRLLHPEMGDSEIMVMTLNSLKMSGAYLGISIRELRNTKHAFGNIVYFLVGSFNELGKCGKQSYFDKTVFEMDAIKKMRTEIKTIIHNESSLKKMMKNMVDMVSLYKDELLEHRDEILDSFIRHLKYWFANAQKRLCKSIQLGIDDAGEKAFEN